MARARNIKPGFYKNEDLAECSVWARYIFPGLWMLADREGRLEDRPKRIKGELLPFDGQDMNALLNELQARGFILRYQNSDGSFIQISKFSTHQSPHYSEKPSAIKGPELPESSGDDGAKTPGELPENSGKSPPIKRGSQPPDSLNPDSLNPESLHETTPATVTRTTEPAPPSAGAVPADAGQGKPGDPRAGRDPALVALVDAARVGPGVGTDDHAAAGELWAILAANSVRGTAQHPQVLEWVRQGVKAATLRRAIAEARKANDGPLNPAYLAPIVERILAGGDKPKAGQAWATDERACEAKARELGLHARPGESWDDLRGRIRQRLSQKAEESVR